MVRSGDDAIRYVDDVLRGKNAQKFSLADDAAPVARAAIDDREPLLRFQEVVDAAPDAACDVAGLVSDAAGAVPGSVAPLTLDLQDRLRIPIAASERGVPQDLATRVIEAAVEMAQSTWLEAADKACEIAQSL